MAQKQEIFTLMGGLVRMRRGRYNPTSDAVWLAALGGDVAARSILDVGIGTGGAALCIAAHNPAAHITGLDTSTEMLAECAGNAALNNRDIELINADIMSWRTPKTFDLVISNPPYFKGTPANHNAHHNADLGRWTKRCVARVRPRGTICMIVDAAAISDVISAMAGTCGDITLYPLAGARDTAERVLVRGRVGTHGGAKIYRPISMNYEPVLRGGLTIAGALAKLGAND